MSGLFILTFQLSSVWSSHLMTDDTVGPELPAATGGWTKGRARGGASMRKRFQFRRPGRMLRGGGGGGRAQAQGHLHPPGTPLLFPCSSHALAFPAPLGKEGQGSQARWAPDPAASANWLPSE